MREDAVRIDACPLYTFHDQLNDRTANLLEMSCYGATTDSDQLKNLGMSWTLSEGVRATGNSDSHYY